MKIAEKDGESQKSLCDSIGLDHSTVAKSLGRLEAQELIERHKCSTDGRVTKVFLSQKGVDATREISRVWADLEKLTIANLTSEEQAQLVAIAEKIVPQMEKGPGGMEKTCG